MNQEILKKNKESIKQVMLDNDVDSIEVTYEGSCDSGAIQDIDFDCDDSKSYTYYGIESIKGPDGEWHESPKESKSSGTELIESVCYNILSTEYAGWENNDGAEGTFNFYLDEEGELTITLNHSASYTETNESEYEF
jgi:hypothetical protein